jgi:hypothetical protein
MAGQPPSGARPNRGSRGRLALPRVGRLTPDGNVGARWMVTTPIISGYGTRLTGLPGQNHSDDTKPTSFSRILL